MNIIICEGKFDAWFFHEIMKGHFPDRILPIHSKPIAILQKYLGMNCFKHVKTNYSLIIFGDHGKLNIKKALERVILDTLGKTMDDIHINYIRDEDGVESGKLLKSFLKELTIFSQDTNSFSNRLIKLESNANSILMKDLSRRGAIKITYLTVPGSLEEQVARRIIHVKYPKDSVILERNPHECIEFIANKYYSDNKEKLFRESSTLLQDEMWVKNCEQFV